MRVRSVLAVLAVVLVVFMTGCVLVRATPTVGDLAGEWVWDPGSTWVSSRDASLVLEDNGRYHGWLPGPVATDTARSSMAVIEVRGEWRLDKDDNSNWSVHLMPDRDLDLDYGPQFFVEGTESDPRLRDYIGDPDNLDYLQLVQASGDR